MRSARPCSSSPSAPPSARLGEPEEGVGKFAGTGGGQFLLQVGELIREQKAGEQQQARVADLSDARHQGRDAPIDFLRKPEEMGLLPIITADLVLSAIHRHGNLRHEVNPR